MIRNKFTLGVCDVANGASSYLLSNDSINLMGWYK